MTKLVKLSSCSAGERDDGGVSSSNGRDKVATAEPSGRRAEGTALVRASPPVVLSNGKASDGSHIKKNPSAAGGGAVVDRLRIRAPVSLDLLRQIVGVVQVSAAPAAPATSSKVEGTGKGFQASAEASAGLGDLSAQDWLTTYLTPSSTSPEGRTSTGLKGTGTGSLAIPRVRSSAFGGVLSGGGGSGSREEPERNPWVLMERVEQAKEQAFKCCGVIEASTGIRSHDGIAASTGVGVGGSSAVTSSMDWNPNFAPRLQEAEAALMEWLTELTTALHSLTFQFTLVFINEEASSTGGRGSSDLAEAAALAEELWTAYEESVKRQLDLTLQARREQLREQPQAMTIALCFTPQNRVSAAELLERKRSEMMSLHQATMGVMGGTKVQPLLTRAEKARQKWSGLLVGDDLQDLDSLVERVLKARLQVDRHFRSTR